MLPTPVLFFIQMFSLSFGMRISFFFFVFLTKQNKALKVIIINDFWQFIDANMMLIRGDNSHILASWMNLDIINSIYIHEYKGIEGYTWSNIREGIYNFTSTNINKSNRIVCKEQTTLQNDSIISRIHSY